MIIIRPITTHDLNIFDEFSFESMLGLTSLPRDRSKWEKKMSFAEKSFHLEISKPGDEEYYFVLEDLTTKKIGGICGILAKNRTGHSNFYRIETIQTNASHLSAPKEMKILRLVTRTKNASEVCSLFLQPTFQRSGQGRLLSLSRFLFIASHKERFEPKMVAEMRGVINQWQVSPFWEGLGKYFCQLSYVELMAQLELDRTLIQEILPKFPLYIDLLPKEVQEVMGKTHDATKPAEKMLKHEGFNFHNEIDSFDGGPLLSVRTKFIRSIRHSVIAKIQTTTDTLAEDNEFILSNLGLSNFRACFGRLKINNKATVLVNDQVAEALQLKNGESLRYVTPQ